ncbi:MAG: Ger(x)C family spore germination protein [Bacillota bacterium]
MRDRALLAAVLSLSLLATGCWDRREIETRGFVLAIGIDLATPEEVQTAKGIALEASPQAMEYAPTPNETCLYRMTIQYPILKRAKAPGPAGGGGGSSSEAAFWNLSGVGSSLFGIDRDFATRTTIPPFYEHLQVVLINAEAAKKGLNLFMDFFFRDPELRRRTPVMLCEQSAQSILAIKPQVEDFTAMYLGRLPRNVGLTARIVHKTELGTVSEYLHNGQDFLLPRIVTSGREIKAAGAGIFREDKLVGWLNEDEMEAVKWLGGFAVGDWITVSCPDHPPGPITVELNKGDTKVKVISDGDKPRFEFAVEMSGNIVEDLCEHDDKLWDPAFLRRVEAQVAKTMEAKMDHALEKLQKELQSDMLHLGSDVERQDPKLWNQIKSSWREIYPTVETKPKVRATIRLVGLTRRSP